MEEMNPKADVRDAEVKGAIEAARENWEKELKDRLEEARREGERAAGMSYEEKLAAREQALSAREKELSRKELRAMAARALCERGLPGELADAVNCENAEAYEESLAKSEAAFRAAVQAEMTKRLGGAAPARGIDVQNPAALTDEQYYAWKIGGTNRT